MAAANDEYRHKYKVLVKELEQQEQYSSRLLEQLSQIVAVLSLGLQGQDKTLDALLLRLQSAMSDVEIGRLRALLKELELQIKQLDTSRHAHTQELEEVLQAWLKLIESSSPELDLSSLSQARQLLPEAADKLYLLAPFISQLLDWTHPQTASTSVSASAQNLSVSEEPAELSTLICAQLIELLEHLNLPRERSESAQELVQRLDANPPLQAVPELLAEVVSLVRMSGISMADNFEDYLLSLNQQLSYVQQFLTQAQKDELSAVQQHQDLDRRVRKDVKAIHTSVKQSNDLDALKLSVTRQLSSIIKTMNHYRDQESQREQALQTRYEQLLEKVQLMESEACEVKNRIEEEQRKARTDHLTGLPNRIAYQDQVLSELERWRRYQTPFTLCVADLDHFKKINDDYGHLAGDKVLRLVAKTLRGQLRTTDFICRFGGEEFVLIFPSTHLEDARLAAEKLRLAVESSPFNFQGEPVHVTMSFGISQVRPGDTPETVFGRADKMLYKAKHQGRNQTAIDV
ncbi:GGDEF domain-containing protein [Nitrincola tapanii]|uniref:diguanylate cyclase n=1 Tax=Nitrincola tapanii TaxID=1708751 RepID=A0A5A9VZG0_9GAMM|nr:GGDEF domain-containing protein [Nitrincola tapanii]KAA0873702.1 GGDEF domain-containing protein [Nitrincola tapanii]